MPKFTLLLALCAGFFTIANPAKAADPLDNWLWENRVFIVFAPDQRDLEMHKQISWLKLQKDGFAARDMVLIQVFSKSGDVIVDDLQGDISDSAPFDAATLLDHYRADTDKFSALLVGKDGGVKARYDVPARTADIFALIDSMPMRQREMEKTPDTD